LIVGIFNILKYHYLVGFLYLTSCYVFFNDFISAFFGVFLALTAITLQAFRIMVSQNSILNAKQALRIQIYSLFIKYVTVIGGFIIIVKFVNIPNFHFTIIGFGLVMLTFLISLLLGTKN
jgi:hypothetical protein